MAFKFKGSLSAVDATLKGGVKFDNEKLPDSKNMPEGKFTINEIDNSSTTDLASNTLVTNFGKQDNVAGMLSFNTGDWENNNSAPVKLMMRVVNNSNDSDWVTIFDSTKTTVTWSSIASAGQTVFTVPNLDFKKAIIYINGILQYPGISYQTFGGTVTFSNSLQAGDNVYIVVGEDSDNTTNTQYISTALDNQTTIILPYEKNSNYLFINGVLQYPNSFTIVNNTITLNSSMQQDDNIFVLSNDKIVSNYTAVAIQDQTDFTITGTIIDPVVYINGVLQYDTHYTISGNTLSFVSKLFAGDEVLVFLDSLNLIDNINTEYNSVIDDVNNSNKINIPYFHFSELQVFINGILQNPDNGAYDLNGTEVTLSSPLQEGDDIHVIVYNSPIQDDNIVTKADLSSYASINELNLLKDSLKAEGINLKWQPHLPSIEVAFGLPRRSLKIWKAGNTSTINQYWLYPVDGTVWSGIGTLGNTPSIPFYKLDSNKDVITWTYTATSDNINRIFVPYNFGSINVFINGVLQSVNLNHFTIDGQYINLNGALQTGDNLIAILGKLVLNSNPYATIQDLSKYATLEDISDFVNTEKLDQYVSINNIQSTDGYKYIGEVPSIEILRTVEPNLSKQKIKVKSYYTDKNVGGGYFYYDDMDTTSDDDGGYVIKTNSGKVWKRIFDGQIKVTEFGAIGDGVSDDAKPFQMAVLCAYNLGGYRVFIPTPIVEYRLSYPVFIMDNTELYGTGQSCRISFENPYGTHGRGGFVIGSSREANRDLGLTAYKNNTYPTATVASSTFTNPALGQFLRDNTSFIQTKNSSIHDVYLIARYVSTRQDGGYAINMANAWNCHAYNIWGEDWTEMYNLGSDVAPETPSCYRCSVRNFHVVRPNQTKTYYAGGFIANSTDCIASGIYVYSSIPDGTDNGSVCATNVVENCVIENVACKSLGQTVTSEGVMLMNAKGCTVRNIDIRNCKVVVALFYNNLSFISSSSWNSISGISGQATVGLISLRSKYNMISDYSTDSTTPYEIYFGTTDASNNRIEQSPKSIYFTETSSIKSFWYCNNNYIKGWEYKKLYLRPYKILDNDKSSLNSWTTNKSVSTLNDTTLYFSWDIPENFKALKSVKTFAYFNTNAVSKGSNINISVRRMIAFNGNASQLPYIETGIGGTTTAITDQSNVTISYVYSDTVSPGMILCSDTTNGLANSLDILITFSNTSLNSLLKEIEIGYIG